ncbi:MAG: formate dehydrogenase accessory sulfurtransferase FdhD [Dehalococcoidales bacterium]|nr:formate dehydrogenase accessory sulfurtransferase FdhD [Dehalococcoidales bacterium]
MTIEVSRNTEISRTTHLRYADGSWDSVPATLPKESALSLFINGQEFVTIQCTPEELNCLVLGFLVSQGLVSGQDDIAMMRICTDEMIADLRLKVPVASTIRRVLTSGCGGGVSFNIGDSLSPVKSEQRVSPRQILSSMSMLLQAEADRADGRKRGVHLSALSDGDRLLVTAADIGRHNTLDKIWGECILRKIPTADRILVTTGRISSEMLGKAVRMRVPIVASLNSATDQAVELGAGLGVTVIGYARGSKFTVFCGKERIVHALPDGYIADGNR